MLQQAACSSAAAAVAAAILAAPVDAAMLQAHYNTSNSSISAAEQSAAAVLRAAPPASERMLTVGLFGFGSKPPPKQGFHLDNPFEIFGFLLKHPIVAAAFGGTLAFAVPRLVRAGIRFIVVPAIGLLVAYLAVSNPSFVWGVASTATSAVVAHPLATSAAILAVSGLLLSPYILFAGAALLLVSGTKVLPPFLRPALPGPVSEAFKQLDVVQGQTRSGLQQLAAAIRPPPALKDK